MARIAFFTLGIMVGPDDDPRVQGFIQRLEANAAAAAASPGFVELLAQADQNLWGVSDRPVVFADEAFAGRMAVTLSLWRDLEAVFAFAYRGVHAEALSRRKEWFVKPEWPSYAAWWVADGHAPTWKEAHARYDRLHIEGPSPAAFNFKQPFDANGKPFRIDRALLTRQAAPYLGTNGEKR